MFEAKAKASSLRGQGQGSRPRPRPVSSRPKPRPVIMIVETFLIKIQLTDNKTFIKAQVFHKIEPQSSLHRLETSEVQSQFNLALAVILTPHCIKVLQIEHINYKPVTGGRCIEAKARPRPDHLEAKTKAKATMSIACGTLYTRNHSTVADAVNPRPRTRSGSTLADADRPWIRCSRMRIIRGRRSAQSTHH